MQNFFTFIQPVDNVFYFPPVKRVTAVDISDSGRIVQEILNNWSNYENKKLLLNQIQK